MDNFIGELTALAAAFSFSLASSTYTLAGRKFGASLSMASSLVVSLAFLLPIHLAMYGELFPPASAPQRWLLLGLSSLVGFAISAPLLLRAFQTIGPRLTMLIASTSPIYAAFMAWLFLGEGLPPYTFVGIALVLGGVFLVVSAGVLGPFSVERATYRKGLATAFGAALAQGASFVLMAEGVAGGYPAMSASIIRTVVGIALLGAFIGLRGKLRSNLSLVAAEPRALAFLTLASLAGPVIGTTLLLVSLQFTSVGISSTLTSTTPIFLIPISFVIFGEAITARACFGTIVAVAGVALLFAV